MWLEAFTRLEKTCIIAQGRFVRQVQNPGIAQGLVRSSALEVEVYRESAMHDQKKHQNIENKVCWGNAVKTYIFLNDIVYIYRDRDAPYGRNNYRLRITQWTPIHFEYIYLNMWQY